MQTVAKFLVEDTFNLTEIGLVLLGQIVEGAISPEDYIDITPDKLIPIKHIEDVRKQNHPSSIILRMSDALIYETDLNKIKGQLLTVYTDSH